MSAIKTNPNQWTFDQRLFDSQIRHMSAADKARLISLSIGRIFWLASRPEQDFDMQSYEDCRYIIMSLYEDLRGLPADHSPNYARDRFKGSEGPVPSFLENPLKLLRKGGDL